MSAAAAAAGSFASPPLFRVDLSLPPKDRWNHVIPHYIPELKDMHKYLVMEEAESFGSVFGGVLRTLMSTSARRMCLIDTDTIEELQGIADHPLIREEIPLLTFDRLLALNIGYDMLARCTSGLFQPNDDEGKVLHFRNMDWGYAECFWPLTIDVDFYRGSGDGVDNNEPPLFRSTTWLGMVGLLTGMRYDGWSISLNYRSIGPPCHTLLNVKEWISKSTPVSLLLRQQMEKNDNNFSIIVQQLATLPLMAPCYLTIAGTKPGEGVILERARRGLDAWQALQQQHPKATTPSSSWLSCLDPKKRVDVFSSSTANACVVTNLDGCRKTFDFSGKNCPKDLVWAEEDTLLLNALERRKTAVRVIQDLVDSSSLTTTVEDTKEDDKAAASSSVDDDDADTGFHILSIVPICNDETVYSSVMVPHTGSYRTRIVLDQPTYSLHNPPKGKQHLDRWQSTQAYEVTKDKIMNPGEGRLQAWSVLKQRMDLV